MIIGLVGRRETGKDTVANYLVERYAFKNHKFAGPLKGALAALFGLTDEHLEGALKEVKHPLWGVSPRAMMQFFGTDIMQVQMQRLMPDMGATHAVRRLFMNLDAERETDTNSKGVDVVVSDVRFPHEVAALRARGALIVRIKRGSDRVLDAGASDNVDHHISESGVDDLETDRTLDNTNTLEELYKGVDLMMFEVLQKSR